MEVQHRRDTNLALRVFHTHHRVRDRFWIKVVSLVILADAQATWRPSVFEEKLLGCQVRFEFPVCKLLDLIQEAEEGSHAGQAPALIILANWATQRTREDMVERLRWKSDLTRRLYEGGLKRKQILELYRLLDWLMQLPDELEQQHKVELREFEESRAMPYITSIERMGREEGREEGRVEALRENIVEALQVRFGRVPPVVREKVSGTSNVARLKRWFRLAVTCQALPVFERAISR